MLKISIIQTNLVWKDKEANLENIWKKIEPISTDIIVLPETFNTGFCNDILLAEGYDGKTYNWMINVSKEKNCAICGSFIFKEDDKYYNRMFFITPNSVHKYDKRHLFGFGGEGNVFTPGIERTIVSYKDYKINLNICYDLRFPVWSRQAHNNEYDILINIANWPASRIRVWETLIRARAIENQCVVVGANRIGDGNGIFYNGGSCFVNLEGEMLNTSNKDEVISWIIRGSKFIKDFREQYPFSNDSDNFKLEI